MKKVRKGKKMLLTMIIAIVVIIAAILIIVKVVNNKNKDNQQPEQQEQIVELPETTTAAGLDAQNISMEYLKDQDRTMITMRITNNTSEAINDEEFNAILIGPDEDVLGQMRTGTNTNLEAGEQCEISVIYKGNMTATQRIKLEPMQ